MKNAKTVKLLGGAVITILIVIGYFLIITPTLQAKTTKDTELATAKAARDSSQQSFADAQKYESWHPQVVAANTEAEQVFPYTASVGELTTQIISAASSAGLPPAAVTNITTNPPQIITVTAPATAATATPDDTLETPTAPGNTTTTPPANTPPDSLAEMTVTITAQGNTTQLIAFLTNLYELDRALLITSITLTESTEGSGRLTVNATSYLSAPIVDPTNPESNPDPNDEFPAGEDPEQPETATP